MSVYQLTHTEAWALALALNLPVQPESALCDWLYSAEAPDTALLPGAALQGLATKGYYRGPDAPTPFVEGLLRSLALISVNAATLTTLIRSNGHSALTRFAQVGDGVVQVGMSEAGLALHDVVSARGLAQTLVPAWFAPAQNEGLRDELPLGAFLLFSHACNLADWAMARSDFQYEAFTTQELLETFQRGAGWLDIFHAAGVRHAPALQQVPLDATLAMLISRGYLTVVGQGYVALGSAGRPLAQALTAADNCTLTVTLQTWEADEPASGSLLHGAVRLFLLEFIRGQVRLQQLSSLQQACAWIDGLLEQGRRARYAEYLIPLSEETPAQPSGANCLSCGSPLLPGARFCPSCGAQQGPSQPVSPSRSAAAPAGAGRTKVDMSLAAVGHLTALNGVLANQQIALGDLLRVGRDSDNDLRLSDERVSRHHALIQKVGERYQISDLGSSNGTWVNDVRIAEPRLLAPGDTVRIGETQFSFSP